MTATIADARSYVFVSNGTKPSTVERQSRGPVSITNFSRPCLEAALALGYKVFLGVNRDNPQDLPRELDISFYDSHTYRNPFNLIDTAVAVRNLFRLLRKEEVDVIHCNTPAGGVVGRICGRLSGTRKVIYTAHGFHFYKGGSRATNLAYRTVEQFLARSTDAIITINDEDFEAAKKFRLRRNGKVFKVPGVGIDVNKFANVEESRDTIRESLGIPRDALVFASAGDLRSGKGFDTVIKALHRAQNRNMHIVICGSGPEEAELRLLSARCGIENQVHLLGHRSDMPRILKASDGFVFASKREGLPRVVMEAMAAGLPCLVSKVRGNVDLINDNEGGYLFPVADYHAFAKGMSLVGEDAERARRMGGHNRLEAANFDYERVKHRIKQIYEEVLAR